jgi:4-amino-4-deoxy-L-arabinose transferase-like glycosyltransferase
VAGKKADWYNRGPDELPFLMGKEAGTMHSSRIGHYAAVMLLGCLLFVPGLDHPLWDVDEAHNAECAREMLDSGNAIVPRFNFVLRTDKPALLYWIMMAAYAAFGVSDWSARLASVVSSVGTLLAVYELGRQMFQPLTGLLAAVVLATSGMFLVASRAATPDALLIFWVTATMLSFWSSYRRGSRGWLIWTGLTTALAVLAKGAVGLVLPAGCLLLFLLWERRLSVVLDRRWLLGMAVFALVALPWYVLVGVETKGEFLRGFFLKHHLERFQRPLEGHGGFVLFHPVVFLATFAPWSAFVGATVWYAMGRRASGDADAAGGHAGSSSPYRLLWCWIAVWFVFFSLAGTKLPNYTLPAFPAWAVLTGRFLHRWAAGQLPLDRGGMTVGLSAWAGIGLLWTAGILIAAGVIPVAVLEGRTLPRLGTLAPLGLLLVGGGVAGTLLLLRERLVGRWPVVAGLAASAVAALAPLAAWGPGRVASYRAPYPLAQAMLQFQQEPEVAIGCYGFYQPSLVWYTQREVKRFARAQDALDHLGSVTQSYLVVPEPVWERLATELHGEATVVARAWDFLENETILLISNRPTGGTADQSSRGASGQDHGGTVPEAAPVSPRGSGSCGPWSAASWER